MVGPKRRVSTALLGSPLKFSITGLIDVLNLNFRL